MINPDMIPDKMRFAALEERIAKLEQRVAFVEMTKVNRPGTYAYNIAFGNLDEVRAEFTPEESNSLPSADKIAKD